MLRVLHDRPQVLAVVAMAALSAAPLFAHVDDADAQLYQVVVRHLAEDHAWLTPRYLSTVHAQFREHLPFGLWPATLTVRAFGEDALKPLSLLLAIAVLATVAQIGTRLGGRWAGTWAVLILGTTESFFRFAARLRLDPLLMWLTLVSVAPLWMPVLRRRSWAWAGVFAALAVAVKGPFGVLPLCAATVGRCLVERRLRPLWVGGCVAIAAVLPVAIFLLHDRFAGAGTWWRGYVEDQLWASASGARSDGVTSPFYPFAVVLGRFWPGVPAVVLGLYVAGRSEKEAIGLRTLAWTCAGVLLGLCLPARKVWSHALVLFPLLAILGGVGVATLLERWNRLSVRAPAGLALLAAALWLSALLGLGRWMLPPPCIVSTDLAGPLSQLGRRARIGVQSPEDEWSLLAELAAERDLDAVPTRGEPVHDVEAMLAREGMALPKGWIVRAHARGWSYLTR